MELMVRTETENKKHLGVEDMIIALKEKGWNAVHTNSVGWNIRVVGLRSNEEIASVWKFAENRGAYGYIPTPEQYF